MRTALITGGARGIGRAIALDLAEKGWNVAICYRKSASEAAQTLAEIEKRGVRGASLKADVSDPGQVAALFEGVRNALGVPDALVHCAGPFHRVPLLEETPAGWREMFSHNLDSFFYCARLFGPAMAEKKWGRIIAFGVANAERAVAQTQVTGYYIAKLGILALVRSFARALAPHGVTVNAISPGFIATGGLSEEELAERVPSIPAGYVGTPTDAAQTAAFLLSDGAQYVNGANIVLSGGWGI